jgi:hypothetical protein
MLGRCWADATMTAEPIQSSDSSSSLSEPSKEYSILGSCQDKKSSTGEPDGSLPKSRCCASPLDPSKATYNQLSQRQPNRHNSSPASRCDQNFPGTSASAILDPVARISSSKSVRSRWNGGRAPPKKVRKNSSSDAHKSASFAFLFHSVDEKGTIDRKSTSHH